MGSVRSVWLVDNEASGSNSEATRTVLRDACSANDLVVTRRFAFPDDDPPSPAALDAAGIETLVVHGGDGTANAAIRAVYGWGGAVLVLPGGTMNLIMKRLHGDADATEIVQRFCRGAVRRVRMQVARCEGGDAFGGLLVGPGTAWSNVREAMRETAITDIVAQAGEALAETLGEGAVRGVDPGVGSREGYPLIELTPGAFGLQADGFHANTIGEFAAQGWALIRRRFREGPHDRIALTEKLKLEHTRGEPLGLLLDGETADCAARIIFSSVPCEVDLIASENGN